MLRAKKEALAESQCLARGSGSTQVVCSDDNPILELDGKD